MSESTRITPGKRDPAGRRRAIIAAATELIILHGPEALTHRAVATRAGVSLGSTTQYFSSLEELREAALTQISDEIDEDLAALDELSCDLSEMPDRVATAIHEFLVDPRGVHGEIALLTSGITDPQLRELALRWPNRLVEILTPRFGEEPATAISSYLDGVLLHTGLRGAHVSHAALRRSIAALAGVPDPGIDRAVAPPQHPPTD